jgi:hypothetical protein
MARKAIVDRDIILNMLQEGETTQHIADKFNVSRQAIDLHRKDFIVKGLLADKRAARRRRSEIPVTDNTPRPARRQPEIIPEENISPESSISLDQQIDLLINAFHALKRVVLMEKELNAYKQENERVRKEIEYLKERERKRLEQENRWLLIRNDSNTEPHS